METTEEIVVAKVAKPKGEKVVEGISDGVTLISAALVVWKMSKYAIRVVQKTKV